jgi:2-methylcitrate dehydratase PrpD
MNATDELAGFIAGSRWEDIPEKVRHEGRRSLLNSIGTALGGCRDAQVEHLLGVLAPFAGKPEAALIGRAERLDALSAAFVNAAASNLHDFDDTHMQTIIHSAGPVMPAVLALGERRRASGRDVLHAFLLGVEAECRVGNAVSPWHYAHGWHISSTCGAVGAAAAAGKLLGLDAPRMATALALGATQACGLLDSLGHMAKGVSMGSAPRAGITGALLAERGFTSGADTLAGKYGFVNVLGEKPDAGAITRGLGKDWEAAKIAFKPYPCGIVLHPVLDALLALQAQHKLKAQDVRRITVRAHSLLQQRTDRPRPRHGREAQVSLQHAAAMVFLRGAAGLRQFTDEMTRDPAAEAFGERVTIVNDDSYAVEAALVRLETADGRTLEDKVAHALGSLGQPMSDAQIEAKVRDCAAFGSPGHDAAPLIDAVWGIENMPDVAALAALARGRA